MIYSFDVFDTALTRAVGSPQSLFLLLGKKLKAEGIVDVSPEIFFQARIQAERAAEKKTCSPGLEAIYQELEKVLDLPYEKARKAMAEELSLEEKMIRPVPSLQIDLRRARAAGRVCFVSDTYFTRDFLSKQLSSRGILKNNERIYASCEYQQNKVSGRLFARILSEEKVPKSELTHCGNDPNSDLNGAGEAGIRALLRSECNLNRHETLMESFASLSGGVLSLFAGASRLTRLNVPAASEKEKLIRDVAAGVAAPLLTGYVLWILQQAVEMKLDRLYFVSRDGQILFEMAKRLAPAAGFRGELRYLYGGRQAWHLPALERMGKEEWFWMAEASGRLSLTSFFARFCILPEEVEATLASGGFSRKDWDRNLSTQERLQLKALVMGKEIQAKILKNAAEKRELTKAYFRQEGLLDGVRWALVDLGWRGRIQNSLAKILTSMGSALPAGFYFGLSLSPEKQNHYGIKQAYFYDERNETGFHQDGRSLTHWMEIFTAADHGPVYGYVEEKGKVTPFLKERKNTAALDWGLETQQKSILFFAEQIASCGECLNPAVDLRPGLYQVFQSFNQAPSVEEARVWASFPLETDPLGFYPFPFAQKFGLKDLWHIARHGKVLPEGRWQAGSRALSGRAVQLAAGALRRLYSFGRRIKKKKQAESIPESAASTGPFYVKSAGKSPLISVVIPCYNQGEFLLDAIKSVEQYPEKIYEMIIVNDGSTDAKTLNVLNDLKKKGYEIIDQPNQGLAKARNNGIARARAPYILALDADNKVRPEYFARSLEIFERCPGVGVVYGNYHAFDNKDEIYRQRAFDPATLILDNRVDACCIFRKQVWEDCRGYDPGMPMQGFEDWDFALTAFEKGWKFFYVPEVLFDYRVRADSMVSVCNQPENKDLLLQYLSVKHRNLIRSALSEKARFAGAWGKKKPQPQKGLKKYVRTGFDVLKRVREKHFRCLKSGAPLISVLCPEDSGAESAVNLGSFHDRCEIVPFYPGHGGLAESLKKGIARVQTDFVLLLGERDRVNPEFIKRALDVFERQPCAGIVHGDCRNGERMILSPAPDLASLVTAPGILFCAFFRRKALENCGGNDPFLLPGCELKDFHLSVVAGGWDRVYLPVEAFESNAPFGPQYEKKISTEDAEKLLYQKHFRLIRSELDRLCKTVPKNFQTVLTQKTAA